MRLTRVQQQARTRAAVLAAAAAEFAEHGFAAAKIDRIAERAELTRGAVYSNFPGKRSLYLAVLLATVPSSSSTLPASPASPSLPEAAAAFARVWLDRLPLAGDTSAGGHLRARSLAGVFDDQAGRAVLGEILRLEGLLLGLALEACEPAPGPPAGAADGSAVGSAGSAVGSRRVRLAELILTLLSGAGHLAQSAPGFGDPFDVVGACQSLAVAAAAGGPDVWDPPYLEFVGPATLGRSPFPAPSPTPAPGDGLLVVLGAGRLSAAEEAVRTGVPATIAVVTGNPAETGALVRLRIADLTASLRQVFPPAALSALRLVLDDEAAALAAAVGAGQSDETESAVRIRGGEIVARAHGRGAAHAVTR